MSGSKIFCRPCLERGRASLFGVRVLIFQEGYVYHIKDEFFAKVQDDKLMQNKENGNFRPTFFCLRDAKTSLLWMIPMSSRVEKYQALYKKQKQKYGKCITIVLGEFDDRPAAFLLQNIFPTTEKYLDHIHTKNDNPVPVNTVIQKVIRSDFQQIRQLLHRNVKIVFPDVQRIENIMLQELSAEKLSEKPFASPEQEHTPINDYLVRLKRGDKKPKTQSKYQEPEK